MLLLPLIITFFITACHQLIPSSFFHHLRHITPATALHIPLHMVVQPSSPIAPSSKKLIDVRIGALFIFDPVGGLRLRLPSEIQNTKIKTLRQAFRNSWLLLSEWVNNLLHPTVWTIPPTTTMKSALLSSIPLLYPTFLSQQPNTITKSNWVRFWRASIPHNTRTVWWRLLTNHIPTRQLLHSHIPTQATSPICMHCTVAVEMVRHFFIDCPNKHRVWSIIVQRHNSDWTSDELITIHTIWCHHWNYIFNRSPFRAGIITNIIDNNICVFQRRIMVHKETQVVETP
ncbi:hypothetical protein BDC45DRAFT_571536 [Circinella umbellata]|nr:hypothetical protein BDC45DRAFT_571536 [Circinella umbellata]